MWILAGDYRCIGVGCSTLLGRDRYKRTELDRDALRDELTRNLKAGIGPNYASILNLYVHSNFTGPLKYSDSSV